MTVVLPPAVYVAAFRASWPEVATSKRRPGFSVPSIRGVRFVPAPLDERTEDDWADALRPVDLAMARALDILAQRQAGVQHNFTRPRYLMA